MIAAEIVEDLQAALDEISAIASSLSATKVAPGRRGGTQAGGAAEATSYAGPMPDGVVPISTFIVGYEQAARRFYDVMNETDPLATFIPLFDALGWAVATPRTARNRSQSADLSERETPCHGKASSVALADPSASRSQGTRDLGGCYIFPR